MSCVEIFVYLSKEKKNSMKAMKIIDWAIGHQTCNFANLFDVGWLGETTEPLQIIS